MYSPRSARSNIAFPLQKNFPMSSAIQKAEYSVAQQVLRIHFIGGNFYDYIAVPKSHFDALKTTSSAGHYFATRIKLFYAQR